VRASDERTHPGLLLVKQGRAGCSQSLLVTLDDRGSDVVRRHGSCVSQQRACRESEEFERIWNIRTLVKIVDAPNQSALGIPPGAVLLDVLVAHRKHLRRSCEFRAYRLDLSGPAKKGRTQKHEGTLLHALVFVGEGRLDDLALFLQPGFESMIVCLE